MPTGEPVEVVNTTDNPVKTEPTGTVIVAPEKGAVWRTRICRWAAPEFGDIGQNWLHRILSVVAFAVGIWAAIEQMNIFNKRYKLAKEYAALADEEWNRFNEKYRPLENAMITDCMNEEDLPADYEGARKLFQGFHEDGYAQANGLYSIFAGYKVCLDGDFERELKIDAAITRDDMINFGYRDAEFFDIDADDQRFDRRSQLLNLGRDLIAHSAKFGGFVNEALTNAGNAYGSVAHDAMYFAGYIRNRREPVYPESLVYQITQASIDDFTKQSYPMITSYTSVDSTVG
jgi:hypothetical protein